MSTLNDYGALLLGSRLRRLSDQLHAGVDLRYRDAGVTISSRCFPLLFLLRDNGPTGITALAAQIGQSHPAVVQLGHTLIEAGLVTESSDAKDERRRLLAVSDQGQALLASMQPIWADIRSALDVALDGDMAPFIALLQRTEQALQQRPFAERIAASKAAREQARNERSSAVDIIEFSAEYGSDFKRLNVEWLERYFYVEEVDHRVLSDPHSNILAGGGRIFLARLDGAVVGTCALIRVDQRRFELSKMAVTGAAQGHGVGRRLLNHALDVFKASGVELLYLESNSKLVPAITMYESAGFHHAPPTPDLGHYQRANVYMEWRP